MTTPKRVAIVTGASRGIGRAIALSLAESGWGVALAAKSVTSTDKLPGSIHTVAEEVSAAGGDPLPIQTDIRDIDQINNLVALTREHFGQIDLLVNNAGALWWKPLLDTPAKRFDLVMDVNARASFYCCQAVLPSMVERKQGHIINMSPPMDMDMVSGRIAYAISKLGMTMLTHGLAEEVREHNIAVNSLWPATIIESQASINHGLGTPEMWRKPSILTECVSRIVSKTAKELTGQALIDEDFLRSEGVTDFSAFACVPGSKPPRLSWKGLPRS